MSKFIRELSSQLNQIREKHVVINNQLFHEIHKAIEKSKKNKSGKNIPITNLVRRTINDNVFYMRRKSVIAIEEGLDMFLKMLKEVSFRKDNSLRRFSRFITEDLENFFLQNQYPSEEERNNLAIKTKLSFKQVTNWFTNKRNRTKNPDIKYCSLDE